MEAKKYLCNQCQELFDLLESTSSDKVKCPRCYSEDVSELIACGLGNGPPFWEYNCQKCGGIFRIKAPRGPAEEKKIRCPKCESRNINWLATASEACPPGG
jgi:DNA-directed RNA polymerase subunit RPC12/RpoP